MLFSFKIKVIFFYFLFLNIFPVGALTSKPYSFLARPWELRSVDSIDIFDSLCSPIRIDVRGSEILRILPRLNDNLNAEWISDKIRFGFDGLTSQRVGSPFVKVLFLYSFSYFFFLHNCLVTRSKKIPSFSLFDDNLLDLISSPIKKHLRYVNVSWFFIFYFFKVFFLNFYFSLNYFISKPLWFRFFANDGVDLESSYSLKNFFSILGLPFINYGSSNRNISLDPTFRSNFLFPNTLGSSILQTSDSVILFGCNLRFDSPLLNSSVRSFTLSKVSNCVFSFGQYFPFSYSYLHLGNDFFSLVNFLEGRHFFCSWLLKFENPLFIFGNSSFVNNSFISFFLNSFLYKDLLFTSNYRFLFLPKNSTVFNLFEAGFLQSAFSTYNKFSNTNSHVVNFLFGTSPKMPFFDYGFPLSLENIRLKKILTYNISCYFGSFANININSSLVLPTVSFFEKNSLYINCYGLIQRARFAVFPPRFSRPEWKTLLFLSNVFSNKLPFEPTLFLMRKRLLLLSNIAFINYVNTNIQFVSIFFSLIYYKSVVFNLFNLILFDSLQSFYQDSLLLTASKTMSLCSQHFDSFFLSNFFFDLESI